MEGDATRTLLNTLCRLTTSVGQLTKDERACSSGSFDDGLESFDRVPSIVRVDDGVAGRLEMLSMNGDVSQDEDAEFALCRRVNRGATS